MNLPSVRTLQQIKLPNSNLPISIPTAKNVRRELEVFRKNIKTNYYQDAIKLSFMFINEFLGFHGIETLQSNNKGVVYYLNTGETYNTTLMYDTFTGTIRVGSWGDLVEKNGARFK